MTIKERITRQNQILEESITLNITVVRTPKGEYSAATKNFEDEGEFVYPTAGEAMEHLMWLEVNKQLKDELKEEKNEI